MAQPPRLLMLAPRASRRPPATAPLKSLPRAVLRSPMYRQLSLIMQLLRPRLSPKLRLRLIRNLRLRKKLRKLLRRMTNQRRSEAYCIYSFHFASFLYYLNLSHILNECFF